MKKSSAAIFLFFTLHARAELQFFPTRLKIKSSEKASHFTVRNASTIPKAYRLQWIFYRMNSDGELAVADDPRKEKLSALPYLVFSPKQIQLAAGAEQAIRVLKVGNPPAEDGEYRAHIQLDTAEVDEAGVAIPVIAQFGKVEVSAELKNLQIKKNKNGRAQSFSVELLKKGNGFLFGDLILSFGKTRLDKREVFKRSSLSSYVTQQKIVFDLDESAVPPTGSGRWYLEFRSSSAESLAVQAEMELKNP